MQLTAVWAMNDLFGVKGLKFDGFADFWWEDHTCFDDNGNWQRKRALSSSQEPQLLGTMSDSTSALKTSASVLEIELSNSFGSTDGLSVVRVLVSNGISKVSRNK